MIAKDKDENMTEKKQVEILLAGIKSTDPSIIAAKTNVFKDYRLDFDKSLVPFWASSESARGSSIGLCKPPIGQPPLC